MVDPIEPPATSTGNRGTPSDGTLGHSIDVGDRPVSVAVVELVASLRGAEPTELKPLYETVDPDALDALFESLSEGRGSVSFAYLGYEVTISAAGTVVASVGE